MMRQAKLFPVRIYCMDADVLIDLKRHYPSRHIFSRHDLFPAIWEKIEKLIRKGEIISHIEVWREIEVGGDELFRWCRQHKSMFKDPDECQLIELQNVKKEYDRDYWNRNINKPGPWADPWLIALAICKEGIIVTNETNAPNKIPFIANHFGITCLNLFEFFNEIGVKYKTGGDT